MKTIHFILGTQLVSSITTEDPLRYSAALFCSTCGEIWGRVVVEGSAYCECDCVPCKHHRQQSARDSSWPGSFLAPSLEDRLTARPWKHRTIETLPPELLRREFTLLLEQYNDHE